jgi:hypothetical protein
MYEIIRPIIDFLSDRSKPLGHRIAIFASIIGVLTIMDLSFNLSYDAYISNKLNNLEKIYQLKEIYKNDSAQLVKLDEVERRTLDRKHYSEYLPFYDYSRKLTPKYTETIEIKTTQSINKEPIRLTKNDSVQIEKFLKLGVVKIQSKEYDDYMLFFDSIRSSQQKITEKTVVKTIKRSVPKSDSKERSRLWMFISSNVFFIFILVVVLFAPFYTKDQSLGNLLIGVFAFIVILSAIMLVAYWTAYLIPLILNNPIWNYLLNFIIHLIFITISIRLIIKASKK